MRIVRFWALLILLLGIFTLQVSSSIHAAGEDAPGDCVQIYGGGVNCPSAGAAFIDKKVRNPASGIFVDNLTAADPKYRPQDIITFTVKLNNTGNQQIQNITVEDVFPTVNNQRVIDFMSGPGTFDQNSNTLRFPVQTLIAGASQTYEIKGRIAHAAALPDKNIICPEPGNIAKAVFNDRTDQDEARFCIEKEMIVPTIPTAGPSDWLMIQTAITAAGATGWYLRKKYRI